MTTSWEIGTDLRFFKNKTKFDVEKLIDIDLLQLKTEFWLILFFCEKFSYIFKEFLIKAEKYKNMNFSVETYMKLKSEFLNISVGIFSLVLKTSSSLIDLLTEPLLFSFNFNGESIQLLFKDLFN